MYKQFQKTGTLTTVTFFIFLVNSLCLTGNEWNKSCSDTVVPICQRIDNREYQSHVSTSTEWMWLHPPLWHSWPCLWFDHWSHSPNVFPQKQSYDVLSLWGYWRHEKLVDKLFPECITRTYHNAHRELRASPRKPNVATPTSRSEKSLIFEVWCLRVSASKLSSETPLPLSETSTNSSPCSRNRISTEEGQHHGYIDHTHPTNLY